MNDTRDDVVSDIGDDIRWLTYAELGRARGISTASATRLAFRRKWRRQSGNNGIVRVAVPVYEAKPQRGAAPDDEDIREDDRGSVGRLVSALETAVSTLREQFARENARADRLEQKRNAEHDRAEAAGVQIEQLRRVLREAEAGLTAERAAKATAEAEATQLRQSLEQAIQAAEAEAARLRQVAEQAVQEAEGLRQADRAEAAGVQIEQLRRVLREAEAGLTAERAAKAMAEAEATQLRQSLEQALADAQEAIRSAAAEAVQLRQANAEAEQAVQAAEAEAARLRQVAEQAVQEAEGLRQAEVARAAAQAVETDWPPMVASRIDEVQFRRFQEAEQARKSLGLLARLRLAWRGE